MFKYFKYNPSTGEYITKVKADSENYIDISFKEWVTTYEILPKDIHYFKDGETAVVEYSVPEIVQLLLKRSSATANDTLKYAGDIKSAMDKTFDTFSN